jgi:predicted TIM-barrel fold metal-dependent hydrolase
MSALSRRELLTGVAALGLGGLPRDPAAAAAPPRAKTLIDFHLHFNPAAPPPVPGRGGGTPSGRGGPRTLQQVLDMMDEGGVALGVMSQGGGAGGDNPAAAAKATRALNEAMAKTIADHPGRFGMFANLPMPYVDESLREMEYAVDVLKAGGVHLLTSYESTAFLGDPRFDPLFQELNRRKILVKTHPAGNPCCQGLYADTGFDAGFVELGTDTMRAIGRVLFSGTAERFPDVPIIWSHSGGSLVAFAQRFYGAIENNPKLADAVPRGPEFYLRRFYYDVAQAYHPVTLKAIKALVPTSQLLFGTDYSFRTALQTIEGIEKSGAFNAQELRAVSYGNGRRLLGLRA